MIPESPLIRRACSVQGSALRSACLPTLHRQSSPATDRPSPGSTQAVTSPCGMFRGETGGQPLSCRLCVHVNNVQYRFKERAPVAGLCFGRRRLGGPRRGLTFAKTKPACNLMRSSSYLSPGTSLEKGTTCSGLPTRHPNPSVHTLPRLVMTAACARGRGVQMVLDGLIHRSKMQSGVHLRVPAPAK